MGEIQCRAQLPSQGGWPSPELLESLVAMRQPVEAMAKQEMDQQQQGELAWELEKQLAGSMAELELEQQQLRPAEAMAELEVEQLQLGQTMLEREMVQLERWELNQELGAQLELLWQGDHSAFVQHLGFAPPLQLPLPSWSSA